MEIKNPIYDLNFLRQRVKEKRLDAERRLQELRKELKGDFEHKRKDSRRISIVEGSFNAVTDGAGSRYISPFALALGANNTQIGFLTSLPALIGNFFQIFSSRAMERFSRKSIMILTTTVQAFFWLLVIVAGVLFYFWGAGTTISITYLIIIYTVLTAIGSFYAPVWSSWMKDLVDPDKSGVYFGMRSKIIGFISLIAMLGGGFLLDHFKQTKVFIGFFILFGICFFARLISSQLLRKKYEPELSIEKDYHFSLLQFIKKMRHNNFGRFVIASALLDFAINMASPFFAVYMLNELGFSYATFTIITVSSIISNFIFMPLWGKFADRYGNVKTLKITAFLTPLVPLGWFFSFFLFKNHAAGLVPFLVFIEFYSGFVFAGYRLTQSNFIYDAVTRQRMALCTSYFNFISSIGTFIGATLAGFLASQADLVFGISIFLGIFLLSGLLRIFFALFYMRRVNEVRMVESFQFVDIKERMKIMTPDRLWQYLRVFDFKAE
jgi:MFS family permease